MTVRNPLSRLLQRWRPGAASPATRIPAPPFAPDASDGDSEAPAPAESAAAEDAASLPEPAAPPEEPAVSEPPPEDVQEAAPDAPTVPLAFEITAHIQGLGDRKSSADGWAGRIVGTGWLEGFAVACDAPGWREHVTFQAISADRSLSPPVGGGEYCGTRGKMIPLHGFVMHVSGEAPHLAGIFCQAVFQDKFRTGLVSPGTPCVSPDHAALVAMRITADPDAADAPAQPPQNAAAPAGAQHLADRPEEPDMLEEAPPTVSLVVHLAGRGDTPGGEDGWGGNPNERRRIEGFSANHVSAGWSRDVTYKAVLADGSLGAAIKGGAYCGTRGKGQPLFGFVVEVAEGRADLAHIAYEGVFENGFKSGLLAKGQICASPSPSPLLAMRIVIGAPAAAENVRLVIWDLDDVFWGGTLTEGGIAWREENAQAVRELARRGIISSICSKNDPAEVFRVLDAHGMREHFVFPSISWDAKGPRLAALVSRVQLRPASVLFIDDNPLNRAEAAHFVPGLQLRDEHALERLLDEPLLQGKPDPDCTRLAHYRLLERRHVDRENAQGDTTQFLRDSGITVHIEHDIEAHIDRAVELINRTNQLNFTKIRLPDDPENPEAARAALRAQLSRYTVQGGLLRVRDRYGDYGYCGFYAIERNMTETERLLHFTFSCRILGMGIETWLYRKLKRPALSVTGPVLADVFDESQVVDWIGIDTDPSVGAVIEQPHQLRYVLARGACDMRALSHYFTTIADTVIEELQAARRGQLTQVGHSLITAQALRGMPAQAVADFAPLGFLPGDFETALDSPPADGPAVWLFGFNVECHTPIYRHIRTGAFLPALVTGLDVSPRAMMKGDDPGRADPDVIAHLREKFIVFGQRPDPRIDDLFRDSLRLIFSRAGEGVRIFVLLSNTLVNESDGSVVVAEHCVHHNAIINEVAGEFDNVELLAPEDFMTADEQAALENPHHFDRIVYFRLFRHIAQRVEALFKT
jgi:FkbH-like protein